MVFLLKPENYYTKRKLTECRTLKLLSSDIPNSMFI